MIIAETAAFQPFLGDLLRWSCAWQGAVRGRSILRTRDRKTGTLPCFEPADHVTRSVEAELDQVAGGENGRAAVVTNEDELLVEAADMRVAPLAIQRNAPLEHRSRDVQAAWDDAVEFARVLRANVDDDPAGLGCGEGLRSIEAGDLVCSLADQAVK